MCRVAILLRPTSVANANFLLKRTSILTTATTAAYAGMISSSTSPQIEHKAGLKSSSSSPFPYFFPLLFLRHITVFHRHLLLAPASFLSFCCCCCCCCCSSSSSSPPPYTFPSFSLLPFLLHILVLHRHLFLWLPFCPSAAAIPPPPSSPLPSPFPH